MALYICFIIKEHYWMFFCTTREDVIGYLLVQQGV